MSQSNLAFDYALAGQHGVAIRLHEHTLEGRLRMLGPEHPDTFRPMVQGLLEQDTYMLLADFQSYVDCQERVAKAFLDPDQWSRMAILNIAHMGKFSSDRSIREYAEQIWKAAGVPG